MSVRRITRWRGARIRFAHQLVNHWDKLRRCDGWSRVRRCGVRRRGQSPGTAHGRWLNGNRWSRRWRWWLVRRVTRGSTATARGWRGGEVVPAGKRATEANNTLILYTRPPTRARILQYYMRVRVHAHHSPPARVGSAATEVAGKAFIKSVPI